MSTCIGFVCRAMRPGEVEGKDYFFTTKDTFEQWIQAGQLLEHALVYGEYKGIPRQQVDSALQQGTDVVLRIDVQVRVGVIGLHAGSAVGAVPASARVLQHQQQYQKQQQQQQNC